MGRFLARAIVLLGWLTAIALHAETVYDGDRPDPLSLTNPRPRLAGSPGLPANEPRVAPSYGGVPIENLMRANLESAAAIDLYRGFNKVFVGRATQSVRDTYVQLADPTERARVMSADVSRRVSGDYGTDPNLAAYLHQQGITLERLERGEKFLIVDNVGTGRLYDRIVSRFPEKYRAQFRAHYLSLAVSPDGTAENPHPESRVFHLALQPDRAVERANFYFNSRHYHNLPQFSGWGHQIVNRGTAQNPRWDVVSNPRETWEEATDPRQRARPLQNDERDQGIWRSENGIYNPAEAGAFQEHQAWWLRQGPAIEIWQRRRALNDELHRILTDQIAFRGTPPERNARFGNVVLPALSAILSRPENANDPFVHAVIHDFMQVAEKNFPESRISDRGLTVNGRPSPGRIDPVAIRGTRTVEEEARESARRRALGLLPHPELLSADEMLAVRRSGARELIADITHAPSRNTLLTILNDEHAPMPLKMWIVNELRPSRLDLPHRQELLRAVAQLMVHPQVLQNLERAEACARLLDRGGAESAIPEEFFDAMVRLGEVIERANAANHPEFVDPANLTPDERRAYFARARDRLLGPGAQRALQICNVAFNRLGRAQ